MNQLHTALLNSTYKFYILHIKSAEENEMNIYKCDIKINSLKYDVKLVALDPAFLLLYWIMKALVSLINIYLVFSKQKKKSTMGAGWQVSLKTLFCKSLKTS